MAFRKVIGTVLLPSGIPSTNNRVIFELVASGYDANTHYVSAQIPAYLDASGTLGVGIDLWTNAESLNPSKYRCTLPDGSSFEFVLPVGSDPADLAELRALGVPAADNNTLLAYIDHKLASIGTPEAPKLTKIAGESISALRWVYQASDGLVYLAQNTDFSQSLGILGITTTSATSGGELSIQTGGLVSDASFFFGLDIPLWLGLNGVTTQVPPTTGNLVIVGQPTDNHTLFINLQPPEILAA